MPYTTLYPWQLLTSLYGLDLSCRLPFTYDPVLLKEDLDRVLSNFEMTSHFRYDHHDGGWNAIGLVTTGGDPQNLSKGSSYSKTPIIKYTPYIEHIIEGIPSSKQRVRLMKLEKKKNIFWHFDAGENLDGKVVRLHIPVVTNENVKFQISHENVKWREGELWYGDFSFPHRLRNEGDEDRIHLVMDLEIDDFIRETFPEYIKSQASKRKQVRWLSQRLCSAYSKVPTYLHRYFSSFMVFNYSRLMPMADDFLVVSDDILIM